MQAGRQVVLLAAPVRCRSCLQSSQEVVAGMYAVIDIRTIYSAQGGVICLLMRQDKSW